jgi:hypothetical protein
MLYGRDDDLSRLLGLNTPVTLISGDSGVGKTSVLEEIVARFDGVAPCPVTVAHSPAALQAALLGALADAAALIARDEGTTRRVCGLLVEGGQRLARAKANEIGVAAARFVLAAIRDRVGANLTDLVIEYFEEVRSAATDDLISRIRQAADPDVIYAVAGLAADLSAATEGGRLLLSLDNVNDLQPDDQARLMDLGPLLPSAIHVICTFTSIRKADESLLDKYALAGISVQPLQGLEQWAVRQWLEAQSLPPGLAEEVHRTTNGYGLAVADVIQLLKSGRTPAEATWGGREQIMRAATREALRDLDTGSRAAALKLSVLASPLPEPRVAEYLGLGSADWAATEGQLLDSHIFVPGNPPWFHDRRRRLLREQLPATSVVPYLKAAAAHLSALAQGADSPPGSPVQYAEITDELVSLEAAEPPISAVARLDDDALAVLGALVELTDGGRAGVGGEQALLYARRVFRTSGDLWEALGRLSAADLAIVRSAQDRTTVAVTFPSLEAWLYANGRIAARLGRTPVPRIASAVFYNRLSEPLGPFASVVYGVGDATLVELASRSVDLQVRPRHMRQIRPGRKGPSLLLKGRFGDMPFYASVAYDNELDRDAALASVQGLSAETVFGSQTELSVITKQPDAPLPSRRLARAFERALGVTIGGVISSFDVTLPGEQISGDDARRQQLDALNLLAQLSSERERQITGYTAESYGLLTWVAPDGGAELTAVVENAEGIARVSSVPVSVLQNFDRVALSELAGLDPRQTIGFTQIRSGRLKQLTDMQLVANEAMRHSRKIMAYNQYQPRRQVPTQVEILQALIQQQLDEREMMAQVVADLFGRSLPTGQDIYLLMDPPEGRPDNLRGHDRGASILEAPMRGDTPQILVAVEPPEALVAIGPAGDAARPASFKDWQEQQATRWRAIFAVPGVTFTQGTLMNAHDAVAELLGHMANEIWLVPMAETSA